MLPVTPIVSLPQGAAVQYINVPVRLLQESLSDPVKMGLVALSVAIKCYTGSSCYRWQSFKKFRQHFSIGNSLAHKLIEHIEDSPLFLVSKNRKGELVSITARSLKILYSEKVRYRRYRTTHAMTVIKVLQRQRDGLRLCDIREEMKELLMLYDINAKQRDDEFKLKGRSQKGWLPRASSYLSVKGIAKVNACSPRTVIRHTGRWEKEGLVSITRFPLWRMCDDMEHASEMERWGLIPIHNLGFRRDFNDYKINDWALRRRFQHIIYGHRRRRRSTTARSPRRQMTWTEIWEDYDVSAKY